MIHNCQKVEITHMFINGWMDTQISYIHMMEYDSSITRNTVLVCVTMWINLKNIMLGEISRNQKNTYYMIPFIGNNQNR